MSTQNADESRDAEAWYKKTFAEDERNKTLEAISSNTAF